MTGGSVEPLRKLFEEWGQDVQFLDVIIRQAHPGPAVPTYHSYDEKADDAQQYALGDNYSYPVLIDDLEGTVHQVYGSLADPTYLIDANGRVAFYGMWTHAPTLHTALEELREQYWAGVVKGGVDRFPHMLPAIADGWHFLRRGWPRSFFELELAMPGSATMTWIGYQLRPLLAPIALRSRPLPRSAKIGLALGTAGLTAAAIRALKGNGKTQQTEGRNLTKKGEISSMKLKPISRQTILITGATSGIGLTTARAAARQGANVMLVARNEGALRELTDEINSRNGGRAAFGVADVADEEAMRAAAQKTVQEFGRIDTWVNNAGGSIYGRIMDVPTDDLRRLFDTNLWGVVNGSRLAVEHLRDNGGALINIGSEVSDSPVPLQGLYSASKHAVKGFTDSLRMELEADGLPITVTLIKPTAIHTPFTENARNYLPYEPTLPPPVYAPELVAEAILHCAETPTREFFVGEMAKVHSSMAWYMPRTSEKINEMMIDSMQNSGRPAVPNRHDGLYETNSKLRERGAEDRFVMEESPYQRAMMHPVLTAGLLVGGGLALMAMFGTGRGGRMSSADVGRVEGRREMRTPGGRTGRLTDRQTSRIDSGEGLDRFNESSAGGF